MRTLITDDPFPGPPTSFWEPGRWPAKWIAAEKVFTAAPAVTAFRRRFALAAATRLRIHVSADERYELFLDGARLGRGPERGDPDNWFFETYDLDLAAGEHVLVARTWWLGPQTPSPYAQMTVRAAFLLAAEGVAPELLNTGRAAWECQRLGGYAWVSPAMCWGVGVRVHIRGSDFPWGFETGAGDGWVPAQELVTAGNGAQSYQDRMFWRLRPAWLPPMREEPVQAGVARHVEAVAEENTQALPVRAAAHLATEAADWNRLLAGRGSVAIPPRTSRRVIVDLRDYHTAYPELLVSGGQGALIRIQWAESLFQTTVSATDPTAGETKGCRNEIEGKFFRGSGDRFEPDGGAQRRFETLWWEAGRYLEIFVRTAAQPLTLESFRLRETGYPHEFMARFESSDARLAPVLTPALRTLAACSHETYMDCPYYEQMMYVGDTRLEVLTTYATTRDDSLPRKALRMFDFSRVASGLTQSRYPCGERQIIPPFSLWWIAMVHDYALWRGDLAFCAARMKGVRGVVDAFRECITSEGLVRAPMGWNFIDWVPAWNTGMPPGGEAGQCGGPFNWQCVLAFTLAAELEDWLHEPELAARDRRLARTVAKAATKAFWDERRGLFADDLARRHFSEHAQCLALLSGCVDRTRRQRAARGLLTAKDLARTTIYFSHYLFETFRLLGRTDRILKRMGPWFDLGAMGLLTTPECPEPSRSDCHAWGAHPVYHYFATILGIRPAQPGFAAVRIEPQLGPLKWARGTLPHPRGWIKVEFEMRRGRLTGSVELPEGLTGVFVHAGRRLKLKAGAQTVKSKG